MIFAKINIITKKILKTREAGKKKYSICNKKDEKMLCAGKSENIRTIKWKKILKIALTGGVKYAIIYRKPVYPA